MSLCERINKKAKPFKEFLKEFREWEEDFRRGASGNQGAYIVARDTRHLFEEAELVRLSDALAVVGEAGQQFADIKSRWNSMFKVVLRNKNKYWKQKRVLEGRLEQIRRHKEMLENLKKHLDLDKQSGYRVCDEFYEAIVGVLAVLEEAEK